jgi:hypothetical protein
MLEAVLNRIHLALYVVISPYEILTCSYVNCAFSPLQNFFRDHVRDLKKLLMYVFVKSLINKEVVIRL